MALILPGRNKLHFRSVVEARTSGGLDEKLACILHGSPPSVEREVLPGVTVYILLRELEMVSIFPGDCRLLSHRGY